MSLTFTRLKYFWVFLIFGTTAIGQDIHFTNFQMVPTSVNPSFSGTFLGTYRISAIYRDQWRNVSNSNPYRTPFLSAEVNILGGLLGENDWITGGLTFFSDRAGTLNFKQQVTSLVASYHYGFDDDYSKVLSIGVSYGGGSQQFNINNLILPQLLETGTNGETFAAGPEGDISKNFSDISVGLSFKTTLNDNGDLIRFGVTGAHITSPNISLAPGPIVDPGNPNPPPTTGGRKVGLGSRITFVGQGSFMTTDKIRINPAILYQTKSGFNEIAVQATADYLLNPKKRTVVTGGLGYRLNDAAELIAGIQLKDLRVGISYDLTTSSFTEAGGGAFELSVAYIGRIYKNPDIKPVIFCPRL